MVRFAGMVVLALSLFFSGPLAGTPVFAAGPTINVDGPSADSRINSPTDVLGWAVDRAASRGTGIDAVHVYMDGIAGQGRFVGAADYGLVRSDVAQKLGSQRFAPSGFKYPFDIGNFSAGEHKLYVYGRSVQSGWTHVTVKIIIETAAQAAPPPPPAAPAQSGYSYSGKGGVPFLAPPPGLPIAGQNYTYNYQSGTYNPAPPQPPAYQPQGQPAYGYNPQQYGAAPPPPPGYGAPNAYASPPSAAWAVAQQLGSVGNASLTFDDAQYLGVGDQSGANLFALMLNPGSIQNWQNQSWDARYNWTLQATRAFADTTQGAPVAFMLMYVSIEPAPAPGDSKWAVTLGDGPQPGSYQIANVLAFGMQRPGEGFQIDVRTY